MKFVYHQIHLHKFLLLYRHMKFASPDMALGNRVWNKYRDDTDGYKLRIWQ